MITCDVAQRPDGLLADVGVGGADQADEGRDGPARDHGGRLLRGPGRDVGQRPGRLKLERGGVGEAQERHEGGDEACSDDVVDGGVPLTGQQLPGQHKVQIETVRTC